MGGGGGSRGGSRGVLWGKGGSRGGSRASRGGGGEGPRRVGVPGGSLTGAVGLHFALPEGHVFPRAVPAHELDSVGGAGPQPLQTVPP